MIPSSPLPGPHPSEELDRQGPSRPYQQLLPARCLGSRALNNNGWIVTVGRVGGKSMCPRAPRGCAECTPGRGAAAAMGQRPRRTTMRSCGPPSRCLPQAGPWPRRCVRRPGRDQARRLDLLNRARQQQPTGNRRTHHSSSNKPGVVPNTAWQWRPVAAAAVEVGAATIVVRCRLAPPPLQGSVKVAVCTQCPSMPAAGTYLPTWINAAMWRWLVMWASDE